jgi:hypothetical protein
LNIDPLLNLARDTELLAQSPGLVMVGEEVMPLGWQAVGMQLCRASPVTDEALPEAINQLWVDDPVHHQRLDTTNSGSPWRTWPGTGWTTAAPGSSM